MGLCSSPIFWHSIKAQVPGRVPCHAAEGDLGLARASGCVSLSSPAEAPIASAASLVQLRVEVVPLEGPDASLAPAAAVLQGIKLLPYSCRTLAVVTAFGAGRRCIPKVLSNGSVAAPTVSSANGMGLKQAMLSAQSPNSDSLSSTTLDASYLSKPFLDLFCVYQ